jgi:hypothetical protein
MHVGGSGGSLEPPGPLLETRGPLLTHFHTVYIAYSERLPTRLNPLAERTCFSQTASPGRLSGLLYGRYHLSVRISEYTCRLLTFKR